MSRARTAARWASLALFVACLWAVLRWAPAGAQDSLSRAERDLSLAVAKVAANEASLARSRPADVALIWQVTEAHGTDAAGRLGWLRSHSSCVLTDRPLSDYERRSNCVWTRGLDDSRRAPEGWAEAYPHLSWSRFAGRWAQVRTVARLLVSGRRTERPCPRTPDTWGGRELDMEQALRRGLRPVGCVGTVNEGFVYGQRGGDA